MYCGHCGHKLKDSAAFCGKCGSKVPIKEKIVYVEEKPIEPILNNGSVVFLTIMFFVLSLVTIIFTSILTNDLPEVEHLSGIKSNLVIE